MSTEKTAEIVKVPRAASMPDDCQRAMKMLAQMVETPLSHEELAEFSMHMASCPACALVCTDLMEGVSAPSKDMNGKEGVVK